jgi:hypothetical protein
MAHKISDQASKGGHARAKTLSARERKEQSEKAAAARWAVPVAVHNGELSIGGKTLACAVLPDEKRVLTQVSFFEAIGRKGRPHNDKAAEDGSCSKTPVFLEAENLKPFIGSDLLSAPRLIVYRTPNGRTAHGYEADLLPLVCNAYLAARRAGVLTHKQEHVAEACEILLSGMAQVGIVALVDEATGYQAHRDKKALNTILDRFLRKEFAEWSKRFPDDFYRGIYKLRGWKWLGMEKNRPQCVAAYTKNLVYERLAPGIVEELETRNPMVAKGRRAAMHHQLLNDTRGCPALAEHLKMVIGFMKAADSWDQLIRMLDKAAPKHKLSREITLFDDLEDWDWERVGGGDQKATA